MKYDISGLFDLYNENLDIDSNDRDNLKKARSNIRRVLRGEMAVECPKFMTQGSFRYGTLIRPSIVPPQEIDLDDGMYISEKTLSEPCSGNDILNKVESALKKNLASYKIIEKDTCVRVKIDEDKHVDLVVYKTKDGVEIYDEQSDNRRRIFERWALDIGGKPSDVLMAHREKNWDGSDPRNIFKWVADQEINYGEDFIKLSRVIKGWRNNQWENSPYSSLHLMALIEKSLEKIKETNFKNSDGRFDILLIDVFDEMRQLVDSDIEDPDKTRSDVNMNDKIDHEDKVDFAKKLDHSIEKLHNAISQVGESEGLKEIFGVHFIIHQAEVKITQTEQFLPTPKTGPWSHE